MSASVDLAPGTLLGDRYSIVRKIGGGGMGTVYEAIDTTTDRPRAIKVMHPDVVSDADLRRRFIAEARVTSKIVSEHIVQTLDAGIDVATNVPFLVMELLAGEDLATMVERRVRLPAEEVVVLLSQAAFALERTHAAGVVHRDLKPENFFVTRRDDGSPLLKVLDFGIAKVVADSARGKTRSLGTPLYMAPEQIDAGRGLGPRADLYALGQIAFTLLVGEPFWAEEGDEAESAYAVVLTVMNGAKEAATVRARRRRAVDLPEAFDAWFARATAVDQSERFAGAAEMIRALGEVFGVATKLSNVTTVAVPPSASVARDPDAPTLAVGEPRHMVHASTPPPRPSPDEVVTEETRAGVVTPVFPQASRSRRAGVVVAATVALVAGTLTWRLGLVGRGSSASAAGSPTATVTAVASAPASPPASVQRELPPAPPPAVVATAQGGAAASAAEPFVSPAPTSAAPASGTRSAATVSTTRPAVGPPGRSIKKGSCHEVLLADGKLDIVCP
jgi:serine/threonine-protein kinase